MYEDLVQAQQPSLLERFVMTSLIPSLLITSFLHADLVWGRRARDVKRSEYVFICPLGPRFPLIDEVLHMGETVPNVFPVLVTIPRPAYPAVLRSAGIEGRVILRAVVDVAGRVEPRSLTMVSATHRGFVVPSQQALLAAVFRPGRLQGRPVRAWVQVPVDFTLRSGTGPGR